jgi:MurNAc alpha-1-phosphate uridylyltransferase
MVSPGGHSGPAASTTDYVGMILAAGLGTRLAPYTDRCPKPLVPLFDVPLVAFAVWRLAAAGIRHIVVNTYHHCEPLEAFLQSLVQHLPVPTTLAISREETLLGTGGGVARASRHFAHRPVLVVNSDLYFDFDLRRLLARHETAQAAATVLLHEGTGYDSLRSTRVDGQGNVMDIGPAVATDSCRRVFAGAYVLAPDSYVGLVPEPSSIITRCFHRLLAREAPVAALVERFPWFDLGTWERYWQICQQVLENQDPAGPFAPILAHSPGKFFPASPPFADCPHRACYLGPQVTLAPSVSIGEGTVLQRGCQAMDGPLRQIVALPKTLLNGPCASGVAGPGFFTPIINA